MLSLYVVSVEDECSPRWKKFIQQKFLQDNKDIFFKVGVKGGDLPTKQYFELGVKGRSSPLTPGEVGCALSHLRALEHFLSTDCNHALILEDDATLPEDFNLQKLEKELNLLSLDTNFLFSLGGVQLKVCFNVRGKVLDQMFLGKKVLKVAADFYHRVCYTVAYIVDRDMAETLIKYHEKLRRADDWSYLKDFSSKSAIYMTYLVDHPIVKRGEVDISVSCIETERNNNKDLQNSRYGSGLRKNIAKIFYRKYPQ